MVRVRRSLRACLIGLGLGLKLTLGIGFSPGPGGRKHAAAPMWHAAGLYVEAGPGNDEGGHHSRVPAPGSRHGPASPPEHGIGLVDMARNLGMDYWA